MDNINKIINYEDFKNVCRVCMLYCDINFTKDSVIFDIFHKLTDIHFQSNGELPEQICHNCFDFINQIHAFSIKCRRSHSILIKCLNNYKIKQIKQEPEIKDETNEEIEIKDEITIEEHKIEFIKVELDNECDTNDPLKEDVNNRTNDLIPPISTEIQAENIEISRDILNSNDLNKNSSNSGTFKEGRKCEYIIVHPSIPEISNNVQKLRYKCNQCEKSFTTSLKCKTHELLHNSERPFKCNQCEKSYNQKFSLKIHKRVHSGESPFICDLCGKSFAHSSHLIRHKRVHSGDRPYMCDQCAKLFSCSTKLKVHQRVHSGERPYKCDQCEKSFKDSGNLITHKRIHSGENPYKCSQCVKSFKRSSDLTRHKRVHNRDLN